MHIAYFFLFIIGISSYDMFYYPKSGDTLDGELKTYFDTLITSIVDAEAPETAVNAYTDKKSISDTIKKYNTTKTAVIFSRFVDISNADIQEIFGNTRHIVFVISLNPYDICATNIITYSNDVIAPAQCIY